MADPKRPSLTVLGGPMAGTRFVIDESYEAVVLGADETCDFRLPLPGVAPIHARIVVDGAGVSIHDAGSDGGLHVNDNPVLDTGTPLRNGDIVWLGSPGEPEVVMLQCILPRAASATAAPSASEGGEDETLALAPDTLFSSADPAGAEPPTEILEIAREAASEPRTEILDIAREALGGDAQPFAREELVVAETMAIPASEELVEPDTPPTTILSASEFEDETTEMASPPVGFPEEPAGTIVVDAAEMGSPSFEVPAEEPTVFFSGTEPEPTLAMPPEPTQPEPPPAPPTPPEPPKTTVLPKPEPKPPRPARPEAPRVAKPAAPAPRPAPKPRPAPAEATPVARPSSGAPVGRYAAMGLVALVVIGAGAWGAMRFLRSKPGAGTAPTPAPVAQTTPIPPPISQVVSPPTTEPSVTPEALPTPLAATPPPVAATPTPRPSATPSAEASPRKGEPTPAPATSVAPSAEALRAAQVASLLGQADASLAARQYDAAVGQFDEVLRLDPGNAKATADRATAIAFRDAARRKFVPGRTVVKTEKASGSLSGFDTGDVALQKAPDFLGRIDFEISPAAGIKPGDGYSLKIILVNEGKKAIRIQGLSVNTVVNGTAASVPTTAKVREVQPQQRAELGEVTGSWKDGTTSWATEVLVTANKGDSLKNTITWR